MCPSWNTRFVTLTILSHCLVSGPFYRVTSLRHTFRCSAIIPDGTPVCPVCSIRTATVISSPSGVLLAILSGCTSTGIDFPSGGCRLSSYYLRVEVCSSPYMVGGVGCNLDCWYHLWIFLCASLVWSYATTASKSAPALLTLRLLSFFSDA